MAKIEIKGSPDELERVATFLANNNIRFNVVKDYGNHSLDDIDRYSQLITKFNALESENN
jgi:predicted esterase YcpF (UPF0227 family)|tara:strand:+ start:1974 stop:2153 length:180 start_codon:yes stop_codon:yes gene_type:complete